MLVADSHVSSPPAPCWPRELWRVRQQEHLSRVAEQADAFVDRRSRGWKHPVHDFLFTYYSFSPAKLKEWIPPLGVSLELTEEDLIEMPWFSRSHFVREGQVLRHQGEVPAHKRDLARWVASLCRQVLDRAPRFRCFGLHEWAMVYRQSREQVRHQGYELRMAPEAMAHFIESQTIGCSHYDAFRFFTPEARPMNVLQPVLETRLEMEQGACLHANMDLYKWATKLWPWIGSELIGECFALAHAGRDLDMRASPYDLRHLGHEPLCIETVEGRVQYEQEQRALAELAVPVRERLLAMAELLSR